MPGGHPSAGPFPSGAPLGGTPQADAGFRPAGGGGPETVSLAGQHPRAEKYRPPRPSDGRRRLDHRDRPASGPDVKARRGALPHGGGERETTVAPDARTDWKQPGKSRQDAGHQPDHPV